MKIGRPTKYTKALATDICKKIADGDSVRTIIKDEKMPSSSTIFRWLLDEKHKEFWEQYEKARNIQAELMFEELLDIADDGENDWVLKTGRSEEEWWQQNGEAISRSRLRVDTRKWYLSKVLPKKFGDKMDIDHTIKPVDGFNFLTNETNNKTNTKTGTSVGTTKK